jgi:hypothetical protein
LDAIRNALDVSIHISFGRGEHYVPLTFREAFYLATLGGATGIVNFVTDTSNEDLVVFPHRCSLSVISNLSVKFVKVFLYSGIQIWCSANKP